MPGRAAARWTLAFAACATLPLTSLLAQQVPQTGEESFEVEPPLLVPPSELGKDTNASQGATLDAGKLAQQLAQAKKSADSAARLVRMGVLAKTEAEQRALRVIRLESDLASAQTAAAEAQVAIQKARGVAGQSDLAAALETWHRASEAAQVAAQNYRKAQLEAATRNLHRQQQLFASGSARKSDVARAEEKLDQLQRNDAASH